MTNINPAKIASGSEKASNVSDAHPSGTLKMLLETIPPGKSITLKIEEKHSSGTMGVHKYHAISIPIIKLHCEFCGGERYFDPQNSALTLTKEIENDFIVFTCRNCGKILKSYALRSVVDKNNTWATII